MPDSDHLPRLTSVVPFLYGVADRSWLPGSVLVRLLVDIGATEDEARRALAKMRADGSLSSERRGRASDYQLAGLVRVATKRARVVTSPGRSKEKRQPGWEGTFSGVLYVVPRAERVARDRLRRAARLAGYGALRPGLMIGFRNAWTVLADAVADLPATASASPVTLGMKAEDARRAAKEAWRLDRAASKIARITDRLEGSAAHLGKAAGVEALRSYVALALPAHQVFVKIPALPVELQPDGWPLPQMITALTDVRTTAGVAAQSYVDELLSIDRDSADATPVGK